MKLLQCALLVVLPSMAVFAGTVFAATGSGETTIRAIRMESNHAIQQGNIGAFAVSLTGDFVMVRGSGAFASRQAYIDAFEQDFKDPGAIRYERVTDKVELSEAAPVAAERGHWIGRRPGGSEAYGGTYLAMWRHTDTGWKIRSELFVVLTCADEAACSAYRATGAQK
jgi:ketosteroid isomerase-like protein